jgi:3-phenylpropionate/trans-cinnamate dioxygenase ferredoxin reductase component
MSRSIVVVGAGLAGLRAVEQLRGAGWTDPITVLGTENHLPYNRPPLTKAALQGGVDPTALAFRRRPTTEDVEWRLGTTVTAVDLDGHTVTLQDGATLAYDGLVAASGVSSRRLDLAAPLHWRHAIRTVEDAHALHQQLRPDARVVIIGAGFIGCEVAATAVGIGCSVTVVEPFAVPLERQVGPVVGEEIRRRHEEHGVRFHLGRVVVAVEGSAETGPSTVVLDDGTRVAADVVVEAVGSVANTGWLEGQGLDLSNGVLCDLDLHPLRSGVPVSDLVAVGDVVRFPVPMSGALHRIEHWTMPTDMAGHAARSLLAGIEGAALEGPPFFPVPTFWSEQYGVRIQSFGLPALGLDDVRVLEGDLQSEAVVGYHRDGVLVGLVLFGMGKQMITYRQRLVEETRAALADLTGGAVR